MEQDLREKYSKFGNLNFYNFLQQTKKWLCIKKKKQWWSFCHVHTFFYGFEKIIQTKKERRKKIMDFLLFCEKDLFTFNELDDFF